MQAEQAEMISSDVGMFRQPTDQNTIDMDNNTQMMLGYDTFHPSKVIN